MLEWALVFPAVSIIAGAFGFTGVSAGIARSPFSPFLAMFVGYAGFRRGGRRSDLPKTRSLRHPDAETGERGTLRRITRPKRNRVCVWARPFSAPRLFAQAWLRLSMGPEQAASRRPRAPGDGEAGRCRRRGRAPPAKAPASGPWTAGPAEDECPSGRHRTGMPRPGGTRRPARAATPRRFEPSPSPRPPIRPQPGAGTLTDPP